MLRSHDPRSSLFDYQSPYEPVAAIVFVYSTILAFFQTSIPRTCCKENLEGLVP